MKKLFLLFYIIPVLSFSQNVGIGTNTPNAKAILDIKATDKGILFPMLTSAQRNAITNPPDGLHIFNKDEKCLNFYDSVYQSWNCYCVMDTCRVVTINITTDACSIDFYNTYAINYPGVKKFVILINPGVTISNCAIAPISLTSLPSNVSIKIINRGTINGSGGGGGLGATGLSGGACNVPASSGSAGGNAIVTKAGVPVTVINYGIIAAGGGGGGGGGRTAVGQFGGGGGGGAGLGSAGSGGGETFSLCIPGFGCSCSTISQLAQPGIVGLVATGGAGGTGASGGGNGGNGGGRGLAGQNGTGTAAGTGGLAGKAISGGSGNSITNISGGQAFGAVD
jgi:hypothetical protein